ncbi:MAG: flagellar motor protein MotB [Helicobacter sp.]|nr:flagellar motor protein MotB [Helicobacter sp.]
MKRKKKHQEHGVSEKWAVPYADFLSLLLALFIALYAISAQNKAKVEALKKEFVKIFDFPRTSEPLPPTNKEDPIDNGKNNQNGNLKSTNPVNIENIPQISQLIQEGAILEQVEQGVTLQLPSSLTFGPNSAAIDNHEMRDYIRDIANVIKSLPPQVKINVRGYTDNAPLSGNLYPDHYRLASARAFNVMQLLIENGVDPNKISFTSFGSNNPLNPNNSIENRIRNNRVEIFLNTDEKGLKETRSILDRANK